MVNEIVMNKWVLFHTRIYLYNALQNNLTYTFILSGLVLALFGIGEILYRYSHIKAEYTRKLVHAGTGIITLLCPLLIDNHWYVLGLCVSFAALLLLSLRYKFLKSINDIGRESLGSLAYPVSVYMCFLAYSYYGDKFFFYLPMLVLAIADPIAAICGNKWPYRKFKIGNETKTLSGSVAFFITACFIVVGCSYFNAGIYTGIGFVFCIAIISTLAESFTVKGLDNFTIPAIILIGLVIDQYLKLV